jgi:hypothetical protein
MHTCTHISFTCHPFLRCITAELLKTDHPSLASLHQDLQRPRPSLMHTAMATRISDDDDDYWSDSGSEGGEEGHLTSVLLGVPDGILENENDVLDVAVSRIGGLPVCLITNALPRKMPVDVSLFLSPKWKFAFVSLLLSLSLLYLSPSSFLFAPNILPGPT